MRELRRKDKLITIEEARELLARAEYGILSTAGTDGQPYGLPLNYVYKDNAIYFHCALVGHKLDNLKNNPKVSFCVVGDTQVLPAEFSTNYISSVAFGVATEAQGQERYDAFLWLLEKYSPDFIEEGRKYIDKKGDATKVIKMEVHHITGKRAPAKE